MKKLSFLIIGFIVLLIILFNFVGVLRPVKNFFRGLINPGAKQIYEWSLALGDKETFHSIAELENAYIELKIKYFQRVTEFGAAQLLRAENEELRALAAFAERTDFNLVGASVIGKNIDNLRHGLVLDKGKKDGLEAENLVVAGDGVYVGKVVEVEEYVSFVQLLYDQNSNLAATVLGREKSLGVIDGGYGLSVQMSLIPQNEEVAVGDIVITSGLEREVPYGLLIGEVSVVEKELYQPFQKAIISPYFTLQKIQKVLVITDFNI